MYELFLKGNSAKTNPPSLKDEVNQPGADKLSALFAECGGFSINNGLYRVHSRTSSQRWSDNIRKHFPEIKKTVFPFGYDWLGRQRWICFGNNKRPATRNNNQFNKIQALEPDV